MPLVKLSLEQIKDIKRLSETSPTLLSAKTKRKKRRMISDIANEQYTHILLEPE